MQEAMPGIKAVTPRQNRALWGRDPLMRISAGGAYEGRVFVEVLDRDTHVVVCGGGNGHSMIARARAALQKPDVPMHTRKLPWTDEAVTAHNLDQALLGRVVVELWRNSAVVDVSGSDPQVLARAMKALTDGW